MTEDSPLLGFETVGVVAAPGPAYVRHMLQNLRDGRVSVPLRHTDDHDRLNRTATTDVISPQAGSGWLEGDEVPDVSADLPAQVSFTSGTEGTPKGVLLSHGNLADAVARLKEAMQPNADIREYIGVPVYHSFGYARARAALSAGGMAFIPEAGFDPTQIKSMLEAGDINALSAVPSQWRVFLRHIDLFSKSELAKIRWVEIGSQPMSATEKAALRQALPEACIIQHYGLTEASRSTLLRVHDVDESKLGSVGRAEGDVDIRISDTGQIETRGPHVALGIDTGDRWHPLGAEAWLTTSDLGRLDDDGFLWFEGRADDIINTAGIKLSPDAIEAHVRREVPEAGAFAVVGYPDDLRGEVIALATTNETAHIDDIRTAITNYTTRQGASGVRIDTFPVDELPVTETGKLQRKALKQSLSTPVSASDAQGDGGFLQEIREILGQGVDTTASFHEAGGDSLQHLSMRLALEAAVGRPPSQWEAIPLADLAQTADVARQTGAPVSRELPPLPDGSKNMNPEDIGFWALVREDFQTNDASLGHQGFWMIFIHRFGNWRMDVRPRLLRAPLSLLYKVLNKLAQILFGMKLDYTVKLGRRVKLEHFGGMILGGREIGDDTILRQNTTIGIRSTDDVRAKPVIGRFVDVGAGAVIVGDVSIGDNAVIGANSVVYTNVPENGVVIGVPGRVIGQNPRQNPSPLRLKDLK